MPTIQYIQEQPFLIPDEVTELPTGTQPALPTIPTKDWYPTGYDKQAQAALPAQPDMWATVARAGKRLLGVGGEERYQTWPERTIRSALTLPAEVYQGTVQSGPGLRREDFTDIPPSQEPQTWIGRKLGLPAVPEQPFDPLIERAQDVAGLAGGTAFSNVALRGAEKNALGIVPVAKARELNIKQSVPSEILKSAVENTPGANIEPDGLVTIKVARKQMPDQEMSESVRGGVFYLPEGDKNLKHYGTARSYYGGQQKIEGDTAFKNPLVVKGATGGKAPEAAYIQIAGKDGFKQLNQDVMKIVTAKNWMQRKDPGAFEDLTNRFFEKYAPELADLKDYIFENSDKGNQLRYALQEAAIGSAVRKAGYDGILGYSLKRGADKGKPFISEIFDVRENRYPGVAGDYSIHPTLLSETSKAVSEKGFPLFTGGIPHVPPVEPTFDERWRERVPDEMMKRDEIKDLLERQKIRNLPLDYTPPERKFEGRPVHLTRIDYKPEF